MKILADTHIHTLASGHAYSTVNEIVQEAGKKGIKLVAITDHTDGMPGGAHDFHFMNLRAIPSELYGVKILKGAEVNIVDYEGNVDAKEEILREAELVIASLHPPCIPFADQETITRCIEKTMENPFIHIIGHPGDSRYPLDFERIVKKAKETGTLLEINNSSLKPLSFRTGMRESLQQMLQHCRTYKVEVVIGTDAHFFLDVGDFSESCSLLEELNFPSELVLNTDVEALLTFISKKQLK